MFIRNSIKQIGLFAAACLCVVLGSCSEENLDTPPGGNPDAAGLSGLIHMASPEDYTSENHIIMLQDDEPESIFLDPAQRSFDPRRPVQVSVTGNRELQLRAYSPRRIRDLKIWASIEGYPDEFLLARFDIVPPFLEFRTAIPFVSADKEYTTAAGKTILILKNPHLGPDDLSLRIECEDPYYKKFAAIKTTWSIRFSNFEYPNHPYWLAMNPAHCREAVAMSLNMAYLFSTQEYQDSLRVNDRRFVDNALNALSAETLLSQSLTRPSFAWGTLHIQGGLGGGGTLGLQDVCFLGHYADDVSDNMALFHEFGHGMGYGHGSNTVISESGGKYSWRQMCQSIYLRQSLAKELPVYSRRFMHSRRNHYDQWSDNRLAYFGAAGRYYRGRHVIEDPELDELDGGLSGGTDFLATDNGGDTGEALRLRLDYATAGVAQRDYAPRDVYVYGDRLYIANDMRPADYSLDVFDLSTGSPKLLKRITAWKDPQSGADVTLGKPTGIYRSYDKIYLSGSGNRVYVFDAETYECLNFLTPAGGAFSVAVGEGVVYSILDAVRAMPEHLVTSQNIGNVPTLATSAKWSRSEDNTLARDHRGEVYAVVNGPRKIVRMDRSLLMSGRLDIAHELTFDHAPQGVCFADDGRMFVSFGNASSVRLARVDPESGEVLEDLTKIGDIEFKNPQKCLIRRNTLFVVDRLPDFCVYAIPLKDLE